MNVIKDSKLLLTLFALGVLLTGTAIHFFAGNSLLTLYQNKAPETGVRDVAGEGVLKPISKADNGHDKTVAQPLLSTDAQPPALSPAKPVQSKQGLPGLFRGDWGATPIYAKNDRVNFERGAYLSLTDGNQNQPPSTGAGYWRLIKKFKVLHEENCFNPAPGADMGECDFSSEEGSLKDRDLHKANLVKARLNGELGSADLSGANLSGAAVLGKLVIGPDTRMTGANLSYLQSEGNNPVIGENANLSGVNFTKASLYGAKFAHADLSQSQFPEAVLTGSDLTSANMSQAVLEKADMSYANLTESKLHQSRLNDANFEQADLHYADLSEAHLQRANLAGVQLAGVNLSGTDLKGANLSSAQGADSAVIDSQTDFTAAICPDGVTVDGTQATTCVGHGF